MAILAGLLLIAVAALQYRWVGQLTRLEAEQLTRSLVRQTNLVARTVERDLISPLFVFSTPDREALSRRLTQWRADRGDARCSHRLLRAFHYDLSEDRLVEIVAADRLPDAAGEAAVEWPPELSPLRETLLPVQRAARAGRLRDPRRALALLGGSPLWAEGPALIRPLPPVAAGPNRGRRRRPVARFGDEPGMGLIILQLDEASFHERIAELVARLAEDLQLPLEAVLLDASARPVGRIVGGAWIAGGEAAREISLDRDSDPFLDAALAPIAAPRAFADRLPGGVFGDDPPRRESAREAAAPWTLAVRPAAGSVRDIVARQRAGNLLLGGAVWTLLAIAALLLLRHARRAEELAARQTDFIASISHELHTPLTAISSAGANLADGLVQEPEKVREYGRMLQREGQRLGRVVGQALALAGVESSTRSDAARCGLAPAVERSLGDSRLLTEQEGVTVRAEEVLASEATIAMREDDLVRVLDNLVENAVKYGGRRVVLEIPARAGGGGRGRWRGAAPTLELHVADDGPGIAPHDRERIWEPFRRGRSLHEGQRPGAGLGLHLVRRLLENAGGSIELAEGRLGEGARFVLQLPLSAPAALRLGNSGRDAEGSADAGDHRADVADPGRPA
ncbi:MAG: sensor histidine kinase [Acidobacteria bacterium]|nr:MAG: sensor histidine kinase [Acidobacteriota bacterium]